MTQGSSTVHDPEQTSRSGLFKRSVAVAGESVLKYEDRAAPIWLFSSIFWMIFVTLVGFTMANELVTPNLFNGIPYLLFSRIRPIHVNGVIFAWLTSMYWGGLFYVLPRLTGRPKLWGEKIAYWTAWAWNLMFAGVVITLAAGYTQGREYWEIIWPLDILLMLIWIANTVVVIMSVLQRRVRPLYVAVWWFLASPLWLLCTYFIANVVWKPGNLLGNGIPGAALSGALPSPIDDAMMNWWGSHNLFGLWLTPMLIGLTYYLVPRITSTPLYSHTLSLLSFWGIAFFYSGVGHHHLLQAPIPGWLRTVAVVNSFLILAAVIAFFSNIWLTMRGNWEKFITNLPLRFTITGFIFYFLVNIQGAGQAVPDFNRMIHFTNWTVAHAHLALLGGFSILGQGVIAYIVPQVYKKPLWSQRLLNWQYWLITIGFTGFFFALTFASFLQGQAWQIGIPEVNVLPMIRPHYVMRGLFGGMIMISAFIQAYNIWRTVASDTSAKVRQTLQPFIEAAQPGKGG